MKAVMCSGLLVLCLGLASGAVADESSEIYKWIDEDGITNYSALPPRDSAAERADVRLNRTNRDALQSRNNSQSDLAKAKAIRKTQEADLAQEQKAHNQDVASQRAQNCQLAQERLTTYSQAQRLYRPTENGEREFLSDDELDTARAEAIALVEEWCD